VVKWLHETAETNPSHRRHGHGGRCCRHLGGYVAALDAVEPYAESRECSDIGRNACPPEPLPRTDSRDPELERPVIEANPTEQALLPLGSPTLVPGTGNLTMQGYAPSSEEPYSTTRECPRRRRCRCAWRRPWRLTVESEGWARTDGESRAAAIATRSSCYAWLIA
jgi:hypothetical protein